ncbi:muramidase family protein [Fundicoccus culcitae]|uniref:LysM peptidoglycan-binding domain-containing protein n=1 Tax=Fundicoccus culcitae TaxID=2969821 RepID=A0ABY5P2Q4_9LACT|nr:LysM peptidoglycan-binding domain-containing protein [Fundicoccus culcitae]UUX32733.1 LysM peptidoglycan-binding domain-containing protein [Fundicoccus culcitae]
MKNKSYRKLIGTSALTIAASAFLGLAPIDASAQSATHTVQAGEYLLSIANQYGVTVEELRVWNGLTNDMIDVGDVLALYGTSTGNTGSSDSTNSTGVHTVQAGQTLYDIAGRYGITVSELMAWNGLTSSMIDVGDQLVLYSGATVNPTPTTPTDATGVHTVQAGQTLYGIAANYGVTVSQLMSWNGLSTTLIDVGDQLVLYGGDGTVDETPAPSGVHVVQSGEYLYLIANNYGVTVAQLRAWNNLASDMIYPGDQLVLSGSNVVTPDPTSPNNVHTVVAGDTLYSLANRYGVTVSELMAWNGLSTTFLNIGDQIAYYGESSGEVVTPPTDDTTVETPTTPEESQDSQTSEDDTETNTTDDETQIHVVAEGENLWRIANQYNVTVHNLRIWNELDSDILTVGQELVILNPALEPRVHIVVSGDNLYRIAVDNHTSEANIMTWNDLVSSVLAVGQRLFVSDPDPVLHEAVQGETLEQIAEQYNVTQEDLREWNLLPENTTVVNGTLVVSDPTGMR